MMRNQCVTLILPIDIGSMDVVSIDIVPIRFLHSSGKTLRECGVSRVTVERGQGYSQPLKLCGRNMSENNSRMVLYAYEAKVDLCVAAITRCAHERGGRIGILPVKHNDRRFDLADGAGVEAAVI